MLSYGSFYWVEALVGEGWWKQRLVNVLLHLGVTVLLYRFSAALMGHLRRGAESPGSRGTGTSIDRPEPSLDPSSMAALQLGVVLFALNPVAVYAVGYLIQRSILMATLFTLVSLLAFLRWAEGRGWLWLVGAVAGYLLAVLSKEHAVAAAALWLPILVFVRRPEARLLLRTGIAAVILVGVVAADLFIRYRNVIGQVFDATSQGYVAQLELLRPGIGDIVYPLSILNQAALFLPYMGLWLVPNVGWMSIDLRPPFPLGFASLPHLLGALGFLALMGWAVVALLRGSDRRGMTGLFLLLAGILFLTEFATVWIQDPFVLYRSYLWAIGLPGLIAVTLSGRPPRVLIAAAGGVALVFGALTLDRLATFRSDFALWDDAVAKTSLFPQANAVGRGRPYLNRGTNHLSADRPAMAAQDFVRAIELGESQGFALYNLGVSLQLLGRHVEALAAFDRAEALDFDDVGLHYHRGESATELEQFALAAESYGRALERAQDPEWRAWTLLRRTEANVSVGAYGAALLSAGELMASTQDRDRALLAIARAYAGTGRSPLAMQALDELLAFRPSAAAHELRADLRGQSGDRAGALADLEEALRMDPSSSTIREKRDRLAGPR
jgi:protein O-mannosyl-transferase